MTNWVVRFSDDENRPREEVEKLVADRLTQSGFRVLNLNQPLLLNPQPLRVRTDVPQSEPREEPAMTTVGRRVCSTDDDSATPTVGIVLRVSDDGEQALVAWPHAPQWDAHWVNRVENLDQLTTRRNA